ncbi:MAG: hypothetical protein P4L40_14680 [Terracidiphilus sp.]|nr:hypothetical protein [Terracidiphilus sp.]
MYVCVCVCVCVCVNGVCARAGCVLEMEVIICTSVCILSACTSE